MATYESGNETREKILQVSECLFYTHGYNKTTFERISKEANVNQGSIYYHFKTKSALAFEIYEAMTERLHALATQLFPNETDELALSLFGTCYIHFYLYLRDERYRRFCTDMNKGDIVSKSGTDFYYTRVSKILLDQLMDTMRQESSIRVDQKERTYYLAVLGSINSLNNTFIETTIGEYTIDDVMGYWIKSIVRLLDLDTDKVYNSLALARKMFVQAEFNISLEQSGMCFEGKLK